MHRKALAAMITLAVPEFRGDNQARGQTICKSHRDGLESSQRREVLEKKNTTCVPTA